jgi:hypothetical protein
VRRLVAGFSGPDCWFGICFTILVMDAFSPKGGTTMFRKWAISFLCCALLFSVQAFEKMGFAADVETVGDLKVSGVIDNSTGEGIKFPDGNTQTTACNACVNGVIPISLGGTGGATDVAARGNLAVPGLSTANTFTTGAQTISTGGPGNNGLVVKGLLGQTADLQQWKTYRYVVASVGSEGDITTSGNVSAAGQIESTSGGFKFPDATVQTTAAVPPWSQILPAAQRFVLVMGDVAVLDKETGLVWQRVANYSQDWNYSVYHCYDLNLGGRKGWRLPSVDELSSLVDPSQSNPALPLGHPFTVVYASSSYYWSSTANPFYSDQVWMVGFSDGHAYGTAKTVANYALCVRGGQ